MADFDRSYHHNYSNSYSYNPRLSTDQNQNPPFSLNPSRASTDQTSSYSYSYSYNTSRPSTDQAPPYDANNSYEYNGRLDIVPRQQPLPPAVVAPRPVAVVGSSSGPWCFGDPEMKRKRRVASYKAYSVEGKVKSSIRKGFRWIKGDSRWCGSQDGRMVGSSLGPMGSIRSALRSVRTNLEADRTVVEPMRPSLSPIGIGPKLVLDG